MVAFSFMDALRDRVIAHPSAPVVLDYTKTAKPWEIPAQAELLMAFHAGWADAPKQKPAGWPHNLKQIQVLSAGVDKYPAWFFEDVVVTCGRGVSAIAIAEYAVTAILCRDKQFIALASPGSANAKPVLKGIAGKTIGLLGVGAIGSAIARRALAFDMRVLAYSRSGKAPEGLDITMMDSAEAMVAECDHLVIAMPLTPQTRGIVGTALLAAAKPGLHIVNVARGEHVDNAALLAAIESGQVGYATLDVTDPEPLPDGHPLSRHPNVLITPHISWMAEDNFERLVAKVYRDLERYNGGLAPLDVVDPTAGY